MHLSPDELTSCCPPLPNWGLATADGALPLRNVALSGTVTGLSASLALVQTFRNDRATPIEAVYTFPLPDHFAVAGLTAVLGDREITGRIDERGRARTDYEDALGRGRRAALLEQERGDVFTAQLGNLAPGEEATITLRLAGRLGVDSGEATLRIPLVVGERYHPGTPTATDPSGTGRWPDTDQVPDASRVSPPRQPGPTGVGIHLDVKVDPAGLLAGTPRVSPGVQLTEGKSGWSLAEAPDLDLDRDLVARFGLRTDTTTATAAFAADQDDPTQGTWQVVVSPGQAPHPTPRTVVLALDRSGSMHGWKIVAARRAAARIIDSLGADDSFLVLGFDHNIETARDQHEPVPATDRNRFAAIRWLGGLTARGGTELAGPLDRAADALATADGERVLVLLTDGQVGNEAALLRLMAERLQGARIYALGVDHAVNATFLRRLAAVGGGRCDLVESEDELDRVLQEVHRRIARPVARGLAVAVEGVRIDRAFTTPECADLFPAGPTIVTGRWRGTLDAAPEVSVFAESDAGVEEWTATATLVRDDLDALRNTWARAHLEKLQDGLETRRRGTTRDMIVEFSLAHQVLCPFTAWLAIGPDGVTGPLQTVVQPVAEHPAMPMHSMVVPTMEMADLDVPDFLRSEPEPPAAMVRPTRARRLRDAGAWLGLARPEPAADVLASVSPMEDTTMPALALAPFADRVRKILARFRAGGDPALARELAELVSDLESVGAPQDLLDAVAGLPENLDEVEELWEHHAGPLW
ncbi:VIT and vWA domain-containing protein [Granulicoccus sp. GXG6511]|uniref:VIT and vWA domain-containing protein n=1 Tax=Granulicoccus sp. GXG6511 TaxID=3381351 RepID=UPI003D7E7974